MESPKSIIEEITDACEGKRCIFRGESKENEKPVSSNFYRKFFVDGGLRSDRDYDVSIIKQGTEEIIAESRRHYASGTSDIEILTQLQHYGGKTTLIDFTYNLSIALFFACNGEQEQDGKLYIYKVGEFPRINLEQSIAGIVKEQNYLIEPSSKEPRVIFQSSVFIYACKGFLDVGPGEYRNIPKGQKRNILEYLRQNYNITAETIYNDIHGFIKNQENYIEAKVEVYKGIACFSRKQYDEAIRHSNEAIEINPQYAAAYTVRAAARQIQGDSEDAIQDYNKVIEIDPKNAPAYTVLGTARQVKGDIDGAIRHYNKAIEINPQYMAAYVVRSTIRQAQGDLDGAKQDLNKAKELAEQQGLQKPVDKVIKNLDELQKQLED